MPKPIYLDNNATTPVDSRVFTEILPYYQDKFGNPSSIDHIYGNEAASAIQIAKEQILELIGGKDSEEIIFTSGATESDNLALHGVAKNSVNIGNHIITTKIEHKAILDCCNQLEKEGIDVTYLNVNNKGEIDLEELKKSITKKTILISIMAANNEVGTIQNLKEIGQIAKNHKVLFHTDAAQAFGHINIDIRSMNIDLMSISGHKIYGPKGIGALYVKRGIRLQPLIYGGGQQRGLRSGTLNVPGIVGLGVAAKYAKLEMKKNYDKVKRLRDELFKQITTKNDNCELNGSITNRLPNNLSIYVKGVEAKALINEVKDEIAISAGSACTAESVKPSHVISALGYDEDRAFSTIRMGLGKTFNEKELVITTEVLTKAIKKLREL